MLTVTGILFFAIVVVACYRLYHMSYDTTIYSYRQTELFNNYNTSKTAEIKQLLKQTLLERSKVEAQRAKSKYESKNIIFAVLHKIYKHPSFVFFFYIITTTTTTTTAPDRFTIVIINQLNTHFLCLVPQGIK